MPTISTNPTGPKPTHFSQHFKLGTTQEHLEFVNIPLDTDAPLFVDPWSFKINDDIWCIECNNLLIDFFQRLLAAIRADNLTEARHLLRPLREPNATRLGLSQGHPRGKGMGPTYSQALVDHLKSSRAFKTGLLRDLSDCELMIPHVSNDRISDITTNVINKKLVEFTKEQCDRYGIKTSRIPAGLTWNPDRGFWVSTYGDLPTYNGKPIILVPKTIVRRKMSLDHKDYWRHYCLEFLQQEHLNSNSSLCRTLKDGTRVPPSKKDLEAELPCDKDELLEFTKKHPKVLKLYKDDVAEKRPGKLGDSELVELLGGGASIQIRIDPAHKGIKIVSNNINVHGDVIGTVGGGTVNARDMTLYKNQLDASFKDESIKSALYDARTRIETAKVSPTDKADAADMLGQITAEIHKPQPDRSKLSGWIGVLRKIVPTAVSALGGIKTIAEIVKLAAS